MSEVRENVKQYDGPYDLYERFITEAVELDNLLLADGFEPEELYDLQSYLSQVETEYGDPMMGMRVTLRGEYAVRKTDEDGDVMFYFDGTVGEISGEYKGLYIFPMLHEEADGIAVRTRVLHRIKHEPEVYQDNLGDEHQITRNTYVSVQGTTLETDIIVNSHSYRILNGEGDWLASSAAEHIDIIATSEEDTPSDKTAQILSYLRTNLADILRDSNLRRNIFSYINSLGLIQDIELLSSVFIYHSDDEYHARFTKSNTYHLNSPTGITVRPDIIIEGHQVRDHEHKYDIFFAFHDDELGQVLIPSNPKYTLLADPED